MTYQPKTFNPDLPNQIEYDYETGQPFTWEDHSIRTEIVHPNYLDQTMASHLNSQATEF